MAQSACVDEKKTRICLVDTDGFGHFTDDGFLEKWEMSIRENGGILQEAARQLQTFQSPVAFPTETVYGLGADATNSQAVKGIFRVKGRPSDNPLIVHVCDLVMLRDILIPGYAAKFDKGLPLPSDPIPDIYKPLIQRFWPGPLTILLKVPPESQLAPEVTAGLPTFGVRMPDSTLALSLISLVGKPLAAPSANASTKPSPTMAHHVLQDLDGKIDLILSEGACAIGVESTVVDGLCEPPAILRPGGVSLDEISECAGWNHVVKAYKDKSELGAKAPRAPGMKYKHYSPRAPVILFESEPSHTILSDSDYQSKGPVPEAVKEVLNSYFHDLDLSQMSSIIRKVGIISTKYWNFCGETDSITQSLPLNYLKTSDIEASAKIPTNYSIQQGELRQFLDQAFNTTSPSKNSGNSIAPEKIADFSKISLGSDSKFIARNLFAALRDLDQIGVDVILIEGIKDVGDIAAAVMNRLRKAATIVSC
ncbi:BgTH12-05939 [Blumeria graminis f. sp. triticale]|uniref:Threonylcarbamoyl-AMP synthase n=1 Tax=Blumeria graminis f. sp. triticale TaxID=1689686 RepID=A0A9W4D3S7_BLUGR|nr:BgTH12-05939 [Blumeria graminis f. sp. triticale]